MLQLIFEERDFVVAAAQRLLEQRRLVQQQRRVVVVVVVVLVSSARSRRRRGVFPPVFRQVLGVFDLPLQIRDFRVELRCVVFGDAYLNRTKKVNISYYPRLIVVAVVAVDLIS